MFVSAWTDLFTDVFSREGFETKGIFPIISPDKPGLHVHIYDPGLLTQVAFW
jgi:hypothetical protein